MSVEVGEGERGGGKFERKVKGRERDEDVKIFS